MPVWGHAVWAAIAWAKPSERPATSSDTLRAVVAGASGADVLAAGQTLAEGPLSPGQFDARAESAEYRSQVRRLLRISSKS